MEEITTRDFEKILKKLDDGYEIRHLTIYRGEYSCTCVPQQEERSETYFEQCLEQYSFLKENF